MSWRQFFDYTAPTGGRTTMTPRKTAVFRLVRFDAAAHADKECWVKLLSRPRLDSTNRSAALLTELTCRRGSPGRPPESFMLIRSPPSWLRLLLTRPTSSCLGARLGKSCCCRRLLEQPDVFEEGTTIGRRRVRYCRVRSIRRARWPALAASATACTPSSVT